MPEEVNTGGGTYIGGNVNTGGGDFVNGDKIIHVYPSPPVPPSALFTLAAPPTDFVGREAELAALRDSFDRGALITGVTGSGGIGKTALARVLAATVAERFPDARLELDLRGTTQPLTPTEAQRALVQPFYPGTPLPDDPAQLAGLYRQTFAQHAALLLLDNAADAAQVRLLLPPAPSAAIVTSRVRFSLGEAGLHPLRLGLLSPEEARELLRRAAPRLAGVPDTTLDALAERCGRLPLALRAAAALLAEREDWTADALMAKLADERRRLRTLRAADDLDLDVEAVLGLSYTTLVEAVQERFRALGVFPALFEKGAACAVWACEDEEADAALGELQRRNLVDYRAETRDYALHDLTRCYAQARLLEQAEEAREAVMRHADYYLEQGSQADDLYLQGGEHVVEGLRRFAGLWPHLQAAWERLSGGEAGWPLPEGVDRWLSDFPNWTVYVLDLILLPQEQIPLQECALEAARRLGDRRDEGIHLGNLGNAYYSLGEVQIGRASCRERV